MIHQGDSYKLYLDYYVNDEPIQNEYTELEMTMSCILENGVSKEFKFYFSKGDISWDETEEKFFIRLSQEQSFLFNKQITYQLRVYLPNGDVYAEDINKACIGNTLSRTVLQDGGSI